jgi:hypothetical protein
MGGKDLDDNIDGVNYLAKTYVLTRKESVYMVAPTVVLSR